MGVELGFSGEVADFYHRYRHGYPAAVIDALIDAFGLNGQDGVVDLGCGTGQMTLPTAGREAGVVGVGARAGMGQGVEEEDKGLDAAIRGWNLVAVNEMPAQ